LIAPLFSDCSQVVGCTGEIRFGGLDNIPEAPVAIRDRHAFSRRPQSLLVRALGSSLGKLPGSLTPSGQRCKPDRGDSLTAEIEWLRGGVMACRLSALENDCFSQDLFALSEIGCGHGEDTLLSRRLLSQGKLLMVFDAVFDHPNADVPKAYCTKAFKMGWGISYSRRLLNDNYRWPKPPTIQDRLALWKSYVGNSALCILRAIGSCKVHRFAFAQGYLMGALQGIVRPPRHFRLTPHIDWQLDAEVAVSHRTSIRNRA
jgi:hypothetical protein